MEVSLAGVKDELKQVQTHNSLQNSLKIRIIQGQTGSQENSESRAPCSANPSTCRSATGEMLTLQSLPRVNKIPEVLYSILGSI